MTLFSAANNNCNTIGTISTANQPTDKKLAATWYRLITFHIVHARFQPREQYTHWFLLTRPRVYVHKFYKKLWLGVTFNYFDTVVKGTQVNVEISVWVSASATLEFYIGATNDNVSRANVISYYVCGVYTPYKRLAQEEVKTKTTRYVSVGNSNPSVHLVVIVSF